MSRKSWQPTSFAGAKPARWSHTSVGRDVAHRPADDRRDLALVVQVLAVRRPAERAAVRVQRGRRLLEVGRRVERRRLELDASRLVVEMDAEDLRRIARRAGRWPRPPARAGRRRAPARHRPASPSRRRPRGGCAGSRGADRRARSSLASERQRLAADHAEGRASRPSPRRPSAVRADRPPRTRRRRARAWRRRATSSRSPRPSPRRAKARGSPASSPSREGQWRVWISGAVPPPGCAPGASSRIVTDTVARRRPRLETCAAKRSPGALRAPPRPDLDGTRHVHVAELLREALDQPAQQRQLGVDPDVRHAAGAPAVEACRAATTYASLYWPLAGSSFTRGSRSAAEAHSQKKKVQPPSPRGVKPGGTSSATRAGSAVKSTAITSPE